MHEFKRKDSDKYLDDESIGFVSWYAEGGEVGAIGHNCVVPLHRRKRYGKKQILMAENQSPRHVHLIKVTTANYSFILPARRTYLSCGFTEVERSQTDAYGGLELIHYESVRKQDI